MQNRIHICKSHFSRLPVRRPRAPRERFIKYYRDLYALHDLDLSEETFLTGSQYSYTELGCNVLEKYANTNILNDIDLFFIITNSHEFDPDYSSAGAYFADKFKLKCKIFDVGDQGSLAFFTGMDLIQKYLHSSKLTNALILVMEQTTIPRNKLSNVLLPMHNSAFALFLGSHPLFSETKSYYAVDSSGILKNAKEKWLIEANIKLAQLNNNYNVVFKKSSVIHQKYQQEKIYIPDAKVKIISNDPGNFPLFSYLHDLVEGRDVADEVFILDEDVETSSVGYLLLRRICHASSM